MPVSEGIQEIVEKHCDDEIILKAVLEVLESGAVSRVALLAGLKDSDIDFLRDAVLEKDDSLKVKKVAIGATFRALVREASFQMDLAETAGRVKHAASRQEQSVIALKSRLKTLKSLFGLDTIDNDVFPTLEVFNKLKSSLGTFVDFKRELHNCKYVPSEKNVLLNLSTGEGQPALAAIPLKESGAGETPDDKLGGSSWLSCFNRYMLGLLLADCDAGDKGVRDNGDGHLPLPNIDPLTLLTYQAKISQIASDSGWSVATLVDDRFRRVVETKFMNGSCFQDFAVLAGLRVELSMRSSGSGGSKRSSVSSHENNPNKKKKKSKGPCYDFLANGVCKRSNCPYAHRKASGKAEKGENDAPKKGSAK